MNKIKTKRFQYYLINNMQKKKLNYLLLFVGIEYFQERINLFYKEYSIVFLQIKVIMQSHYKHLLDYHN